MATQWQPKADKGDCGGPPARLQSIVFCMLRWLGGKDLNPQHSDPESDVLPVAPPPSNGVVRPQTFFMVIATPPFKLKLTAPPN